MTDENPFAAPRSLTPEPPPKRKRPRREVEDLPSSRYFIRFALFTAFVSALVGGGLIFGAVVELGSRSRDIPVAIACLLLGIGALAFTLRQFRTVRIIWLQDRKVAAHKAKRAEAARLAEEQEFSGESDTGN
jgi:hypothetical protein